ncbi:hypothetical protein RFI_08790, partial [Reticulomyxa filosa]
MSNDCDESKSKIVLKRQNTNNNDREYEKKYSSDNKYDKTNSKANTNSQKVNEYLILIYVGVNVNQRLKYDIVFKKDIEGKSTNHLQAVSVNSLNQQMTQLMTIIKQIWIKNLKTKTK